MVESKKKATTLRAKIALLLVVAIVSVVGILTWVMIALLVRSGRDGARITLMLNAGLDLDLGRAGLRRRPRSAARSPWRRARPRARSGRRSG